MSRLITGVWNDPLGDPVEGGYLHIYAVVSYDTILEGTYVDVTVSDIGEYSVTLEDGRYWVFYVSTEHVHTFLGYITVIAGSSISLEDLLLETNPLIPKDIRDYIDARMALVLTSVAENYVPTTQWDDDIPGIPEELTLVFSESLLTISVGWDPTLLASGGAVKYDVTYWSNILYPTTITCTSPSATIRNVRVNTAYTIEVKAYPSSSPVPASAALTGNITTTIDGVPSINPEDVTGTGGVGYIHISWPTPPIANPLIHIYAADNDLGPPVLLDSVYASSYLHMLSNTAYYEAERYYWFEVEDIHGDKSSRTGPTDPFASISFDSTTIGQLLTEGAIEAQQLADGAVVQDKLAAHAIAASKLAVLDLNNLVHNHNFTVINDAGTGYDTHWDASAGVVISNGYVDLPANSTADNDLQTECDGGTTFYCSAVIKWTGAAGAASKGLLIVFLDDTDTEIQEEDYTAEDTETTFTADTGDEVKRTGYKHIHGFVRSPANAKKVFIRIKTESVSCPTVTFTDITLRYGSATLIKPGEITVEQINVNSVFASQITIQDGGLLQIGENPTSTGGIIFGYSAGLTGYNSSGNIVFQIPADGSAFSFGGTVNIGTGTGVATAELNVYGTLNAFSEIILGSASVNQGSIHSYGKGYSTSGSGFWMGYDAGGTPGWKLILGNSTNYVNWNGSSLSIQGAITATSGTFTGTVYASAGSFSGSITATGGSITGSLSVSSSLVIGSSGSIYSSGKTYNSNTAGYFLGYSGGYVFEIGKKDGSYIQWDGANLNLLRNAVWDSGSITWASDTADNMVYAYAYGIYYKKFLVDTGSTLSSYGSTLGGLALESRARVKSISTPSTGSASEYVTVFVNSKIVTGSTFNGLDALQTIDDKIYIEIEITDVQGDIGAAAIQQVHVRQIDWSIKELL